MDERAARRAEELFNVYEAAFPDEILRREWEHVTMRERNQWLAVADALAQAVQGERERCVQIVERGTWLFQEGATINAHLVADTRADIVAALRAPLPPEVTR